MSFSTDVYCCVFKYADVFQVYSIVNEDVGNPPRTNGSQFLDNWKTHAAIQSRMNGTLGKVH